MRARPRCVTRPVQAGPPHRPVDDRRLDARARTCWPAPTSYLRPCQRGAALPARRGAPGPLSPRSGRPSSRASSSGSWPCSPSSTTSTATRGRIPRGRPRGHHPVVAHSDVQPLPQRRRRHPAGQRRPGPRRWARAHPRRGGRLPVIEDNVRMPSGASYVIANRRAMADVCPAAFSTMRIRPVDDYPRKLLGALRAAAPTGRATRPSSSSPRVSPRAPTSDHQTVRTRRARRFSRSVEGLRSRRWRHRECGRRGCRRCGRSVGPDGGRAWR